MEYAHYNFEEFILQQESPERSQRVQDNPHCRFYFMHVTKSGWVLC